jgi:hypothetical protein
MKEFFSQEFGGDDKVVDVAVVNLRTAYIAYETKEGVVALVCLLDYVKNDHYNFGYKDMDETMGPLERECPERILKLLTAPPANEYARQWREDCWENLRQRQSAKKPEVGMLVRFKNPISFTDNTTWESMRVYSVRPLRLIADNYRVYQVSRRIMQEATLEKGVLDGA